MAEDRDWEQFKQKLKAKTEIDLDLYKEDETADQQSDHARGL